MDEKERNRIIAQNIKKYIKENKITQKKLAEAIGISPSTLSDYMNLRSNPSHGVIQKIADYFGIVKSDIDTTYKVENDISSIFDKLSPPRQKKVFNYAKNELQEQNKNDMVVPMNNKNDSEEIHTLAAHAADPSKEYSQEEIDNIKSVLDEARKKFENKNRK